MLTLQVWSAALSSESEFFLHPSLTHLTRLLMVCSSLCMDIFGPGPFLLWKLTTRLQSVVMWPESSDLASLLNLPISEMKIVIIPSPYGAVIIK